MSVSAWLVLIPAIDRLDNAPAPDGGSSSTAVLPPAVTTDEVAAVSFPFSGGIHSLPEECAEFWDAFGSDPVDKGYAPEDNGITILPAYGRTELPPEIAGEPTGVGDVDGDTVNDGVAVFRCTNEGVSPPTGVLVLRASDRTVTTAFAGPELDDALMQALGDTDHYFTGRVGVVAQGEAGAGQIYVQLIGYRPDDPDCCPSMHAEVRFRFENRLLRFVGLSEFTPL